MFLSVIKLFISCKQFIKVIMVDGNISLLIQEKANNSQPCSINKADMFFPLPENDSFSVDFPPSKASATAHHLLSFCLNED